MIVDDTSLPMIEIVTPHPAPTCDVTLSQHVLFIAAPDGSARLMDFNGSFYAVDEIGALFLHDVLNVGREEATTLMSTRFGVDVGEVRHDLDALLHDLASRHLVHIGRDPASSVHIVRWTVRWQRILVSQAIAFLQLRWLNDVIRVWSLLLLARVSFGLFGWARTVDMWRGSVGRAAASQSAEEISDLVAEIAATHWVMMECKERSLCSWTLMRWRGIGTSLVVGISLYPLKGHCWCVADGSIVGDDPERCSRFTPVLSYS